MTTCYHRSFDGRRAIISVLSIDWHRRRAFFRLDYLGRTGVERVGQASTLLSVEDGQKCRTRQMRNDDHGRQWLRTVTWHGRRRLTVKRRCWRRRWRRRRRDNESDGDGGSRTPHPSRGDTHTWLCHRHNAGRAATGGRRSGAWPRGPTTTTTTTRGGRPSGPFARISGNKSAVSRFACFIFRKRFWIWVTFYIDVDNEIRCYNKTYLFVLKTETSHLKSKK